MDYTKLNYVYIGMHIAIPDAHRYKAISYVYAYICTNKYIQVSASTVIYMCMNTHTYTHNYM